MFRASIIGIREYQTYLKSSLKSFRALLLFVFPFCLFFLLNYFNAEIAAFIQSVFVASADRGMVYYSDLVSLAAWEILWVTFFFLLTWVLILFPSKAALENVFNTGVKPRNDHYVILIVFLFFIATLYVCFNTTEGFPVSSDEYAYLFQAEMFSRGKLWEPAHDLPAFFYDANVIQQDGIQVSRFPPGWPIFLSAALEAGISPSIVNPALAVLTLIVFYFFASRVYDEKVAVWSLIVLAFTGYFVFNSASFFSHVSCLLATLLFVCNIYLYDQSRSIVYGVLAGVFLSLIGLIRYYNALLVFLPFLIYIVYRYRIGSLHLFFAMAIGVVPVVLFLLSYNYSITGDPSLPVQWWAFPEDGIGFVGGHTLADGLGHAAGWIILFFYWCSPGLFILYAVYLYRKIKVRNDRVARPEEYLVAFLLLGHVFYYSFGGDQYGPRYLFEGFPFLVLLVVGKVLQSREKWAMALLLASILYGLVKLPFINYREERIVDERQDLYDLIEEQKITDAVVFISSGTSPLRPLRPDQLTRNDPRFRGDVIYAIELPGISDQLVAHYNDRSFYRYVRHADHVQGELIRMK
jgi:hypothetical protein